MDLPRWSEALSVGNPTLDAHHQHLFALLAEIHRVAAQASGLDAVQAVLRQMTDYIGYHFAEEEAMLAARGFPFIDLHRQSHQSIAVRVGELAEEVNADNCHRMAGEICTFLNQWLIHHIEIEDFEYTPFLGK